MRSNLFLLWIAGTYLLTRNPHPGFGDSLGFLYHAEKGFDLATNATSHFLYINFSHLLTRCLPFLESVTVLSLLSVVFALLAMERLYQLVLAVNKTPVAAASAVLMMAFCFTWWRQAVTIEVYTFYCAGVLQVFVLVVRDVFSGEYRRMPQTGLWLGLSVLTHIQTLLLVPFYLYYLWRGKSKKKQAAGSLLIFAGLGSILILLPAVYDLNPVEAVFFDNRFGSEVLGIDPLTLLKGSLRSLGYLLYNFHVFTPLIIHGIILAWKQDRQLFKLLGLAALPVWLFAMRYNVTDNYVFFLVPYFVLAVFSSLSFKNIYDKIQSQTTQNIAILLPFIVSPLVYFFIWKTALQIPAMQEFAAPKAYKGGLAFYLWPGQTFAPDPLELARKIHAGEVPPIEDFERYPMALQTYLLTRQK
ncbi:MAG: DUF2723 domain-containing protein [Bacteroidia bacterium]|nr:DUF2723 domain-containing protein [Bacteroidia bacterium]